MLDTNKTKNKIFISYLLILIGLFILVFITKGEIYAISENNAKKDILISEEKEKRNTYKSLTLLESEFNLLSSKKSKYISKYLIDIKEDEIINFLYGNISTIFDTSIEIKSLTISGGEIGDLGFRESTIGLNLIVSNEQKLIKLLDFLLEQEKYNFFIDAISYPYEKANSPFSISIPIKVLYK